VYTLLPEKKVKNNRTEKVYNIYYMTTYILCMRNIYQGTPVGYKWAKSDAYLIKFLYYVNKFLTKTSNKNNA